MTFQWWSLLPFAAMLASIAILPIIPATSHWWEKRSSQLLIALVLGAPTLIFMYVKAGSASLIGTGVEYIQFITLLFALFVISAGLRLEGDIQATPRNNTIFLAAGGILASFVGTTGAAMLLIRPILETNRERDKRVHTVLFTIFIVANCGGLLTPLGDPPLFLGFLQGVPFAWTLGLWKEWVFVLAMLLFTYYSVDSLAYALETGSAIEKDQSEVTPLRLKGTINLLFFALVILAVAFVPSWDGELLAEGKAQGAELVPWRELLMLAAAGASYIFGDKKVRYEENAFTWAPISEVATLFIGIFSTMAPALRFLEQVAPSLPLNRVTFFLFSGSLSSVLDNAPTYLTFFEMAKALGGPDPLIAGVPEYFLIPISLGAVLCGAMTYIGNGPNFMVKSVAEADNVPMPSFGAYVVRALEFLAPILAAMAFLFIAESGVSHIIGLIITLGILGFSTWRIARARTIIRS